MATDVRPKAAGGLVPYRLTVEQFCRMIDAGILPDRDRVELIRGRLVKRMTKNHPHNYALAALSDRLRSLLPPDSLAWEDKSLRISGRSRPEPDLFVTQGPLQAYRARDPEAADVALVVEVADTSYGKDRGAMWRLYAGAGIPVYWVVNLPGRRVEVYSEPTGRGKAAGYQKAETFGPGAAVPVVVGGREAGRVAVDEILP